MKLQLFSGDERLERWPAARRVVRMGTPEALGVGDLVRARDHALASRFSDARAYLEAMHPNHLMMVEVTYEWCLRANRELLRKKPAGLGDAIESEWKALAARTPDRVIPPPFVERLSAAWLAVNLTAELAKKRGPTLNLPNPALTDELESLRKRALAALEAGRPEPAANAIEAYFTHARICHDALIEYLWAFSTAVARQEGETAAKALLTAAFRSVPAVNMMWPALHLFGPLEIAFFLADHLR
jgi:hypothetical protein